MDIVLLPGERLCGLGRRGFQLIQMPGDDCFSQDSVLLADFARAKPGQRVCDLAAGSGAVSVLLLAREPEIRCEMVEIRQDLCRRAERSARLNGLSGRLAAHCLDLKQAADHLGRGEFDLVVSNPPYHPVTGDAMAPGQRLARQQLACDIIALAESACSLLRRHGRLCLCCSAGQVLMTAQAMRQAGLEPKRLRFVAAFYDRAPYLCLMEGMKGAKPGLLVMPQLVQFERPGTLTPEMAAIYTESGETE